MASAPNTGMDGCSGFEPDCLLTDSSNNVSNRISYDNMNFFRRLSLRGEREEAEEVEAFLLPRKGQGTAFGKFCHVDAISGQATDPSLREGARLSAHPFAGIAQGAAAVAEAKALKPRPSQRIGQAENGRIVLPTNLRYFRLVLVASDLENIFQDQRSRILSQAACRLLNRTAIRRTGVVGIIFSAAIFFAEGAKARLDDDLIGRKDCRLKAGILCKCKQLCIRHQITSLSDKKLRRPINSGSSQPFFCTQNLPHPVLAEYGLLKSGSSPGLRIDSSAQPSQVAPMTDFRQNAEPPRIQWRYRS